MQFLNINNVNVDTVKSLLKSNFVQRAITAILLGIFSVYTLLLGYPYSQLYIVVFLLAAIIEWGYLIYKARITWGDRLAWFFPGLAFILWSCYGLFSLLNENVYFFLAMLSFVWSTDIGAYIFGRWFKGPKLAPQVSPNKTWAGSIGGFLTCVALGIFLYYLDINTFYKKPLIWFLKNAVVISIIAQIGDLIESWIKRKLGVKDSGIIIPGHGGILDRLDSVFAVGCAYAIIRFL